MPSEQREWDRICKSSNIERCLVFTLPCGCVVRQSFKDADEARLAAQKMFAEDPTIRSVRFPTTCKCGLGLWEILREDMLCLT